MSHDGWNDPPYLEGWSDKKYSFNVGSNFGQEQQFQSFDYSYQTPQQGSSDLPTYGSQPSSQPSYFVPGPQIMTPGPLQDTSSIADVGLEEEPPLLEELGIDPDAIVLKTLNVLNPLRHTDPSILQDTDLAGPLMFCLAFGSFLLLSGKVHFGYIYGIGLLGCLGLYSLLNLMSIEGVGFGVVVSVLGYCLLPMVGLSGLNVFISLQGAIGIVLTIAAIVWCSWSASKLFVTVLAMHHKQPLVAYPCALFYAVFALITIF